MKIASIILVTQNNKMTLNKKKDTRLCKSYFYCFYFILFIFFFVAVLFSNYSHLF